MSKPVNRFGRDRGIIKDQSVAMQHIKFNQVLKINALYQPGSILSYCFEFFFRFLMSLYFDCAVSGGGGAGNIHVSSPWHPNLPYLAVGSYSGIYIH